MVTGMINTVKAITPLEDASGLVNTLTNVNAVFDNPQSAYNFTGTQYLYRANFPNITKTKAYTVSCWVYLRTYNTTTSSTMGIWSNNANTNDRNGLMIDNTKGLRAGVYNGASYIGQIKSTNLTLNTWYHVVVTWNGTNNMSMWLNNVYQTLSVNPSLDLNNTFVIGGNKDTSAGFRRLLNGSVNDLRIFNRALTTAEITTLYGNGTITSGLVAWYPMNNNTCDYFPRYTSGDWIISGADNCVLSTNTTLLSDKNITVSGTGTLKVCSLINGWKQYNQVWTTRLDFCASGRLG